MPFEIRGIVEVALGTVRHFKYEIYDKYKSEITISSCTFRVWDADFSNQLTAGTATVNNADTDAAGNTIKTVQMNIDFGDTDFNAGHYWLVFKPVLSTGESDEFRVSLEIKDFNKE